MRLPIQYCEGNVIIKCIIYIWNSIDTNQKVRYVNVYLFPELFSTFMNFQQK